MPTYDPHQTFTWQQFQSSPGLRWWYGGALGRPAWVIRFTLLTAVLVVAIPLALLALAAVLVGVVVFFVLSFVAAVVTGILSMIDGITGRGSTGRRNVRVIHRP